MNTTPDVRLLVESVVTSLCHGVIQRSQDFKMIRTFEGESVTLWNLESDVSDRGRIIGRGGDRFRALRHVAHSIGQLFGHECKLGELRSSNVALPRPFPAYSFNPSWPREEVLQLARVTAIAMFGHQSEVRLLGTPMSTIIQIQPNVLLTDTERRMSQESLSNIFGGIGTTHGAEVTIDITR